MRNRGRLSGGRTRLSEGTRQAMPAGNSGSRRISNGVTGTKSRHPTVAKAGIMKNI